MPTEPVAVSMKRDDQKLPSAMDSFGASEPKKSTINALYKTSFNEVHGRKTFISWWTTDVYRHIYQLAIYVDVYRLLGIHCQMYQIYVVIMKKLTID